MSVATAIRAVFTQLMWSTCWLHQLAQSGVSVLQMDNIVAAIFASHILAGGGGMIV